MPESQITMVGAEAILPQSSLEATIAKTLNRVRRTREKAARFTTGKAPVLQTEKI